MGEALVDGLANGADYTVTVTALTSHPDVEGPASEPRTVTPASAAGDTGGSPDPVPALPLAGAGVLAGLLAAAGPDGCGEPAGALDARKRLGERLRTSAGALSPPRQELDSKAGFSTHAGARVTERAEPGDRRREGRPGSADGIPRPARRRRSGARPAPRSPGTR